MSEGIDLFDIHDGDEVTLELTAPHGKERAGAGTFTITGPVYNTNGHGGPRVGGYGLMAGSDWLGVRRILTHTPKNPEWWSWPLLQFEGHLYALGSIKTFHSHRTPYCGCKDTMRGSLMHHRALLEIDVVQMEIREVEK